ncbi:ABC transporter ATP-binding protein [Rubellicoccus peritrichatus]|uniref:ATP-binding cassette domain-containing protein n=1 Tax=Rubellicoccus peritrichatus TaxID=3080537 RepID=A0AAQ3L7C1_9BACT|nr:ATP-binding cassette domain-containing protein [Puniceicoccus sp. CR14]WOO40949.1 ATP-binding cassette domain-containing protein [Puniceicoccus sp. CR14]
MTQSTHKEERNSSELSKSEIRNSNSEILTVSGLRVYFPIYSPFLRTVTDHVKAVDDVSFSVKAGTTVGLVGESGSGKTTIGRSIIKLAPITGGQIKYRGVDIASMPNRPFFPYRKKIQMVFQDPFNSLNPRMTIYQVISEPLEIHFKDWNASKRRERVAELLKTVGLEADHMERYPHEFSGGQRQRIGIARALAVEPEFIICDEPVSALDVSVQAQIVNLLQDLQAQLGLTYLFIAHDLAVVEHISDEVLVMTGGKIVEQASADEIYSNPQHEYTRKLLDAVPQF